MPPFAGRYVVLDLSRGVLGRDLVHADVVIVGEIYLRILVQQLQTHTAVVIRALPEACTVVFCVD